MSANGRKKKAPPSANLRKFLDPEAQIADMDEREIDMHVVFTGPVHMSAWWADPQTALKLPSDQVEELISAGHDALKANPVFRDFLKSLTKVPPRGRPIATVVPGPHEADAAAAAQ